MKSLATDPDLSFLAPIDSPHFTGVPTAPTAADGTDTDQLATTKYVRSALTGGGTDPNPSTGDTIITTVVMSATPPSPLKVGQFWYDFTTGILSLYVDDTNTKQWVAITPLITSV